MDFEITTDAEKFKQFDGVRINYSKVPITNTEYRIGNVNLLFENNIQQQQIECFETNGYKAFFKTDRSRFSI